jgi:hypothetical protein
LIQHTYFPLNPTNDLKPIADQVGSLRRQPNARAPIIAKLEGSYRIVGYNGTWVEILLSDGRRGWSSVDQFCTEDCAELLQTADFANDILAVAYGARPRRLTEGLTREAKEMSQQLAALERFKISQKWQQISRKRGSRQA